MEVERPRYRGIIAGATPWKPQEHLAVQSAVPEFDGPKLGNDGEAEARDVRREKTKFDQSAGILGAMEIERLRYAAWQAPRSPTSTVAGLKAGVVDWIQTVSGSLMSDASYAKWLHDGKALCAPTNAIRPMNATRDAGLPESSVRGTPDQYEEINLGSVARCVRALGGAVQVNVPEVKRPELETSLTAQLQTERPKRWTSQMALQTWAQRRRSIRISTGRQRNKSCSRRRKTRGRTCRGISSKRYMLSPAKRPGPRSSQHGGAGSRSRPRGAELRQTVERHREAEA